MFLTKIYFTIDSHIPNRRAPVFGQQTKLTPKHQTSCDSFVWFTIFKAFGRVWTPKSQQKPSPTTVGVEDPMPRNHWKSVIDDICQDFDHKATIQTDVLLLQTDRI